MKLSAALIFLCCIALLGGCADPRFLVPGQSTTSDVRARLGTPTDTYTDRNGDQLWQYASGPEGFTTYQVRLGTDGRVKEVTQLLTEEQLAKVSPGTMTKAEVKNLLGRPTDETIYGAGLTWSWRFSLGGNQPGFLVVTFNPDNTVRDKIVIIDPSGDDPEP